MRFFRLTLLLSVTLATTGCYWSFAQPLERQANTEYRFDTDDFEVLGLVSTEGETKAITSLFIWDDNQIGYGELINKARKDLGADTVIDVAVDRDVNSFLLFLWKIKWRATGLAIRYKNRATARQATVVKETPAPITAPAIPAPKAEAPIAPPPPVVAAPKPTPPPERPVPPPTKDTYVPKAGDPAELLTNLWGSPDSIEQKGGKVVLLYTRKGTTYRIQIDGNKLSNVDKGR